MTRPLAIDVNMAPTVIDSSTYDRHVLMMSWLCSMSETKFWDVVVRAVMLVATTRRSMTLPEKSCSGRGRATAPA